MRARGGVVGFFEVREHIFPAYDTAKVCRQTMCRPASFQKRELGVPHGEMRRCRPREDASVTMSVATARPRVQR